MYVKITNDGMIQLPSEVMHDLDIHKGDDLMFVKTDDGYLIVKPATEHSSEEQRLAHTRFVRDESKGIMEKLTQITLADDIYSEDEIYLCNVIAEKIFEYQEFLNKVLIKNKVTMEEYMNIHNYKKNIIEMAQEAASKDDDISIDEKKILNALQKIIEGLN